jgi:hypothetical protein
MLYPRQVLKRIGQLSVLLAFFVSVFFTSLVSADHLLVSRYFSGAWTSKDHQSQGIMLHIAEQPDESKVGVAHWFTFGNDLESAWYVAAGPVEGHEIVMKLFSASGVGFLEPESPESLSVAEIGTLILSFHNCNQGTAFFDTPEDELGSGEFDIRRLTSLYHSRCSGGLSDDTPSDKRPEKLDVDLNPVREDVSGKGKAKFWQRPDRSDFAVGVEGMPDGIYDLMVCDADQGDLEIIEGEGGLEFRSPEIDSKLLLNFDPRDCQIDLVDGMGTAFSSGDAVLMAKDKGKPEDKPGNGSQNADIKVDLTNTGVIVEAEGEAGFAIHGVNTEFEIEIENVPPGFYPLVIDGDEKAQIEVVEDDGKFKGKLKFASPEKNGSLQLNFDPRDSIIEVLEGDAVILESLFPDK